MSELSQETGSRTDETTAEGAATGSEAEPAVCPECGSTDVVEDPHAGELVCGECGLVIEERTFDRGPQRRGYTREEREEKARTGPTTTPRLHDRGLATEIDWRDFDAYGRAITPERRAQMERLREWHRRLRARGRERSLRYALGEIERMASSLGVPTSTREEAAVIFRRAMDAGLLTGRSIEGVAAAALYAACRRERVPRSLDAIANASRVDRSHVARTYRLLSRELELGLAPADPAAFVSQIVSALDLSDRVERRAIGIIRETAEMDLLSGKSPKGYAAAAVYLAARVCGERVTQRELAGVADVGEVTIRNRYHEQADALGIEY